MAAYPLNRILRFFNYTRGYSHNLNLYFINDHKLLQYRITSQLMNISGKNYSDLVGFDEPIVKKKKTLVPRITLLSENDNISIVTFEEAQKIAKRRDLKLTKIVDFDTKSERPIYKLLSIQNFLNADQKNKAERKQAVEQSFKNEKTITLTSKISEHDLNTKLKTIVKLLEKKHAVRAVISIDGNKEKTNTIIEVIIAHTKDVAKVINKSTGGFAMKIFLRPISKQQEKENTKNEDSSTDNVN